MRAAILGALLGAAVARSSQGGAPVRETIDETTVGMLGEHRVPMGNMTTGAYTKADGTEARGVICSLVVDPQQPGVFVGLGSAVTVGGVRWEVVAIEKTPGTLGSVTLERR